MVKLKEVLEEPFGPYPEGTILKKEAGKKGDPLVLRSVSLRFQGRKKNIGLDDTEFVDAPQFSLNPVEFYGLLVIDRLELLSAAGQQNLQEDLNQRAGTTRGTSLPSIYQGNVFGTRSPNLNLKIKVLIIVKKTVAANYLNDRHPTDLIMQSEHRSYKIASMVVETYKRSAKFLERFRIYSLLRQFAEEDKNTTTSAQRNLEWFAAKVKQYHRENSPRLRLIPDPEQRQNGDVDVTGHLVGFLKPRAIRHIPRAEIICGLAPHAEWLLAQELVRCRSSKSVFAQLLNLKELYEFCLDIRQYPKKWKVDVKKSSRVHLEDYGGDETKWRKMLNNVLNPKKQKQRQSRQVSQEFDPPARRSTRIQIEHEYDETFSEASTPDPSGSEYNSDRDPDDNTNHPSLWTRIPLYFERPPTLGPGQFVWRCPAPKCLDQINFLDHNETQISGVSEANIQFFENVLDGNNSKRRLLLSDRELCLAFYRMVSDHNRHHVRQMGLSLYRDPSTGKVILREANSRSRRAATGGGDPFIKNEDVDVEMPPSQPQGPIAPRRRRHP